MLRKRDDNSSSSSFTLLALPIELVVQIFFFALSDALLYASPSQIRAKSSLSKELMLIIRRGVRPLLSQVSGTALTELTKIDGVLTRLQGLESVTLNCNPTTKATNLLGSLILLPKLRFLSLDCLFPEEQCYLAPLTGLRELRLERVCLHRRFSDVFTARWFSSLCSLHSLSLSSAFLRDAQELTSLTSLSLTGSSAGVIIPVTVQRLTLGHGVPVLGEYYLTHLVNLTSLDYADSRRVRGGCLSFLHALQTLVPNESICDEQLATLPNLTSLDLGIVCGRGGKRITGTGLDPIVAQLRRLRIDDASQTEVLYRSFSRMTSLRHLNVRIHNAPDILIGLTKLRSLSLHGHFCGGSGGFDGTSLLALTRLRTLHVLSTHPAHFQRLHPSITSNPRAFSRLTSLTDLYLYQCNWFASQSLHQCLSGLIRLACTQGAVSENSVCALESRCVNVRVFGSVSAL